MNDKQIELMLTLKYGSVWGAVLALLDTPKSEDNPFTEEECEFLTKEIYGKRAQIGMVSKDDK